MMKVAARTMLGTINQRHLGGSPSKPGTFWRVWRFSMYDSSGCYIAGACAEIGVPRLTVFTRCQSLLRTFDGPLGDRITQPFSSDSLASRSRNLHMKTKAPGPFAGGSATHRPITFSPSSYRWTEVAIVSLAIASSSRNPVQAPSC
jgi:hypothetical protein